MLVNLYCNSFLAFYIWVWGVFVTVEVVSTLQLRLSVNGQFIRAKFAEWCLICSSVF